MKTTVSLLVTDRKQMAEFEMNGEEKIIMEENEEKEDQDNIDMINKITSLDTRGVTTSSPLKELNLLIILSFLSLSPEESLNLEEINEKMESSHKDSKQRHPLSANLQIIKEREMYESRSPERQSPRFQTKIRDSRHCRRM
ncbi:hypothetical protein ACH5RR_024162 [Cinchona calisaya]|uniref:Uncharacterized protein n=1 Tax=Cinchona calisaya TaxID=153742 RepID=A0ABD2ZG60_9GENT